MGILASYGCQLRRLAFVALLLLPSTARLVLPSTATAVTATAATDTVAVRWLGVAGFSIEAGPDTLLHDPYLSRPGMFRTFFRRYVPDPDVLEPLLAPGSPAPELSRGDLILIGHSHFDHLADAPWIAERTGATVVGSATTVAISRGFGLGSNQVRQIDPDEWFEHGGFDVRVVESRHMALPTGNPPAPGVVDDPPDWPMLAVDFRLGDARGYHITHRPSGLRLFFLSSAGFHPPALAALREEGVGADVLIVSTSGRSEDYVRTLLETFRPRWVVPQHFDNFFIPLVDPKAAEPIDRGDLEAFEAEVTRVAEELGLSVKVRRPSLFEAMSFR